MPVTTYRYTRPPITKYQQDAIWCDERWSIIEASTKAGKSMGCLLWILERALIHGGLNKNFWWVAPTHSQARIMFRRLKSYLPHGKFESNESEQTITLPNNSVIWFKSGAIPDNLYGEDVYAVVLDEVTRIPEESWFAIRSTLTATQGPCRMIGNVKGTKNWAYQLARKAELGNPGWRYSRITAWDAVAAGVLPREEVEDAQRNLPTEVFAELYLAQASKRERFFSGVPKILTPVEIGTILATGSRTVRGWDFAVSEPKAGADPDWTAGVRMSQAAGLTYVTDIEHFRKAPDDALKSFEELARKDLCDQTVEEERGAAGKMFISTLKSALARANVPVAVHASPVTGDKMTRAFTLAATWNDGNVVLADGSWVDDFLLEADLFPYGTHDDMIDAAAHAFNHLAGRDYLPGSFTLPIEEPW